MSSQRRAVVLLSGGLDSAVCASIARHEGLALYALTVDYGQRHRAELDAATNIAGAVHVERHLVLPVDLTRWGGSALTGSEPVPTDRTAQQIGSDIPITYVPARNTIFLALAMGWAETLGTGDIYIGAHSLDYSGYPDCRPEYFSAFEQLATLATKAGVEESSRWRIHAPLLRMMKTEIVQRGAELCVPFALTRSCYQPSKSGAACGRCDACRIRLRAFDAAGLTDPVTYETNTVAVR